MYVMTSVSIWGVESCNDKKEIAWEGVSTLLTRVFSYLIIFQIFLWNIHILVIKYKLCFVIGGKFCCSFLLLFCFLLFLLMWWRKEAQWFDRQRGRPVACHMAREPRQTLLTVSEDTMGWFHTTSDLWLSVLDQLERGLALRLGWRLPERRRTSSMRSRRTWIRRRDEPGAGVYVCRRESWPSLPVLISFNHSFIDDVDFHRVELELESDAPVFVTSFFEMFCLLAEVGCLWISSSQCVFSL